MSLELLGFKMWSVLSLYFWFKQREQFLSVSWNQIMWWTKHFSIFVGYNPPDSSAWFMISTNKKCMKPSNFLQAAKSRNLTSLTHGLFIFEPDFSDDQTSRQENRSQSELFVLFFFVVWMYLLRLFSGEWNHQTSALVQYSGLRLLPIFRAIIILVDIDIIIMNINFKNNGFDSFS